MHMLLGSLMIKMFIAGSRLEEIRKKFCPKTANGMQITKCSKKYEHHNFLTVGFLKRLNFYIQHWKMLEIEVFPKIVCCTDSTKINRPRPGYNIRMYWTKFRQPTAHVQQNIFGKSIIEVCSLHLYASFGTFCVQIGQSFALCTVSP